MQEVVIDMNMNAQLETARRNMVENQVRPWEVLDARVLGVLSALPRDAFVRPAYKAMAYADVALPLGHDEVMWKRPRCARHSSARRSRR